MQLAACAPCWRPPVSGHTVLSTCHSTESLRHGGPRPTTNNALVSTEARVMGPLHSRHTVQHPWHVTAAFNMGGVVPERLQVQQNRCSCVALVHPPAGLLSLTHLCREGDQGERAFSKVGQTHHQQYTRQHSRPDSPHPHPKSADIANIQHPCRVTAAAVIAFLLFG
jgi:hypothetical protein